MAISPEVASLVGQIVYAARTKVARAAVREHVLTGETRDDVHAANATRLVDILFDESFERLVKPTTLIRP